jgi:hypothetical protein
LLSWSDNGRLRAAAAELVGQVPDVIVVAGTPATTILRQLTNTIPIVFERAADPIATSAVYAPTARSTGFLAGTYAALPPKSRWEGVSAPTCSSAAHNLPRHLAQVRWFYPPGGLSERGSSNRSAADESF